MPLIAERKAINKLFYRRCADYNRCRFGDNSGVSTIKTFDELLDYLIDWDKNKLLPLFYWRKLILKTIFKPS